MTLTSSADLRAEASTGVTPPATPPAAQSSTTTPSRARRAWSVARRQLARLAGALVVLLGAASLAFAAQVVLPGDRATIVVNVRAGQGVERTPEELAAVNAEYGFLDPVLTQYGDYLRGLLRGDLGDSYQQHRPVTSVIAEQLGPTVVLTVSAIALGWVLMLVWVTLTAGRGPGRSALGSTLDTVTAALPHYWLGVVLLLVFAQQLGWFPVGGGTGVSGLVLPALTLAVPLAGFMGQATRTEFERALESPFVLTARTRGMSDLGLRLRHVVRHASLPAINLSGWALGATISGAVVVESVFTRAGLGRVLVNATNSQDLPVVTGVVLLVAALYVVANLLVDAVHAIVDPRLRAV